MHGLSGPKPGCLLARSVTNDTPDSGLKLAYVSLLTGADSQSHLAQVSTPKLLPDVGENTAVSSFQTGVHVLARIGYMKIYGLSSFNNA